MTTQDEHLDYILDRCIERIAAGESVSSCLASYPDDRDELEPLLRVAAVTMRAVSAVETNRVAKARGLRMLNDAVAERTARKRSLFGWLSALRPPASGKLVAKPLLAGVAVLVVASGLAFGADRAAADSVPGDPLYWVKTSRESLSLMMPKSDAARAQEHARLAKVRSDEMGRLVRMGDIPAAQRHSVTISLHLSRSAELVGVTMSTNPIEMPARMGPSARGQRHRAAQAAPGTRLAVHQVPAGAADQPPAPGAAVRTQGHDAAPGPELPLPHLDARHGGRAGLVSTLDHPAPRRTPAVAGPVRRPLPSPPARVVDAGLPLV